MDLVDATLRFPRGGLGVGGKALGDFRAGLVVHLKMHIETLTIEQTNEHWLSC